MKKEIHLAGDVVAWRMEQGAKSIREYMANAHTYWDSKRLRVERLAATWEASKLLEEILLVIIPCTNWTPIQNPAGKIAEVLPENDIFDNVKTAAELIAVASSSELYDILLPKANDENRMFVKANVTLPDETIQYINSTAYILPSLIEPRTVKQNHHTGYLTHNGSLILGNKTHHNHTLALDAINIANKIPLSLDIETIMEDEPVPKDNQNPQTIEQHEQFVNECQQIHDEMLAAGNRFYLTWKFDKRGRMYSQGYHINIQATEYRKASISLANKEIIR